MADKVSGFRMRYQYCGDVLALFAHRIKLALHFGHLLAQRG